MPLEHRATSAALATLIVLQSVMLAALYFKMPPHPPASTPVFGMAPFLAAALSCAGSALILGPLASGWSRALSALAAILALVSFGPQKYFDPQFALIWPAVISGQLAAAIICIQVARTMRATARQDVTGSGIGQPGS